MAHDRIHHALEDLIKAASEALGGDRTGLMDAIMAARSAARAPLTVKPLSWREIDPGRCLVGAGHGFTCQINHVFNTGGYEVILPSGRIDTASMSDAKVVAENAYAATIWSCIT